MRQLHLYLILAAFLPLMACSNPNLAHEDEVALPSGDTLVHVEDWNGRQPVLNDSAPLDSLYIRWKGETGRELVDSGGAIMIQQHFCRLWRQQGRVIIQVGDTIYHRLESGPRNEWSSWSMSTTPRIYERVRDSLEAAGAPFTELPKGEYHWGGIEVSYQGERYFMEKRYYFYLPYEIADMDFEVNWVRCKLSEPVPGLPATLIFPGPRPPLAVGSP